MVILTRPNPQLLLWACYLASLVVSIGGSVLIFLAFQSREVVAGTSSHHVGPAAYLTVGVITVLIAAVLVSRRGRELFGRDRSASGQRERRRRPGAAAVSRTRAKAEQALGEGSLVIACVVGALLAVPGPFDLLALGHLARNGYGVVAATGAMVVFALIKFVLIELPIAGFAVDPDGTAARVGAFSDWMKANKVAGIAAIVGVFGLVLIGRGVSGLR
jgi:hypothetical protein